MDIICYGAVTNYGATVNGEIEALCQFYDKSAESFPSKKGVRFLARPFCT